MRPLTLAGLAAVVALTVVATIDGAQPAGLLAAVASVAAVVGLVAVVRGDLPINQRMATWTADALTPDWRSQRRRWERWFAVRTAAAFVAAGACLAVLAAVGPPGTPGTVERRVVSAVPGAGPRRRAGRGPSRPRAVKADCVASGATSHHPERTARP